MRLRLFALVPFFAPLLACGGQTFDVADSSPVDVGSDAPVDWASCATAKDCQLVPATCCGKCGTVQAGDVVSISKSHAGDYRSSVCGTPGPPCPGCASRPNPSLQATCSSGHCAVLDIAASPFSDCATDADCMLRAPECCEPCGLVPDYDLVALSKSQLSSYLTMVCAGAGACPDCLTKYPPTARAACDTATHHCVVIGGGI